MAGRMNFEFTIGRAKSQASSTPESDDPLRILILGDFSGASAKPRVPLRQRPLVRVDVDNFDEVLRRFAPCVKLGGAAAGAVVEEITIQELDDFRPEHLCQKLPTLRRLADLRKSLLNPATFDEAAAQLKQQFSIEPESPASSPAQTSAAPAAAAENDASVLERILGKSAPVSPASTNRPGDGLPFDMQKLIGQLVQPHLVPAANPNQKVYLAAANSAVGDRLRAVLHDRSFQALEATWRSLRGLISSIEDDSQIKIQLLDVSAKELRHDVPTSDEGLRQWSLYGRLNDEALQSSGSAPWSLIIGDTTFTSRIGDLALLGALTIIAEHLQIPLVTAADSSVVGTPTLLGGLDPTQWRPLDAEADQYWQALRKSPAAAWVGLACPRVLLRLPYGKDTDEVEGLEFEEFTSTRQHEDYLWGNSAYACAQLIGQGFAADGWSLELGRQLDIEDLPSYTYREDGEVNLLPCAEVTFSDRVAEAFLQRGVMPLVSRKDRNAVRLARFQSIANPPTALAGPWT